MAWLCHGRFEIRLCKSDQTWHHLSFSGPKEKWEPPSLWITNEASQDIGNSLKTERWKDLFQLKQENNKEGEIQSGSSSILHNSKTWSELTMWGGFWSSGIQRAARLCCNSLISECFIHCNEISNPFFEVLSDVFWMSTAEVWWMNSTGWLLLWSVYCLLSKSGILLFSRHWVNFWFTLHWLTTTFFGSTSSSKKNHQLSFKTKLSWEELACFDTVTAWIWQLLSLLQGPSPLWSCLCSGGGTVNCQK